MIVVTLGHPDGQRLEPSAVGKALCSFPSFRFPGINSQCTLRVCVLCSI